MLDSTVRIVSNVPSISTQYIVPCNIQTVLYIRSSSIKKIALPKSVTFVPESNI
jgi:hypothetical protein